MMFSSPLLAGKSCGFYEFIYFWASTNQRSFMKPANFRSRRSWFCQKHPKMHFTSTNSILLYKCLKLNTKIHWNKNYCNYVFSIIHISLCVFVVRFSKQMHWTLNTMFINSNSTIFPLYCSEMKIKNYVYILFTCG